MKYLDIKEKVSFLLEEGERISSMFRRENIYYLSTEFKTGNTIGGFGPITYNIDTEETKRIHYLEMPSNIGKVSLPTNLKSDQIIKNIRNQKYLSDDDIYMFWLNEFGEESVADYSFLENSKEKYLIQFFNSKTYDLFYNFLIKAGLDIKILGDDKLLIAKEMN